MKNFVSLLRFQSDSNFLDRLLKDPPIPIHGNPSFGSRVVSCGQSNGRTVMN